MLSGNSMLSTWQVEISTSVRKKSVQKCWCRVPCSERTWYHCKANRPGFRASLHLFPINVQFLSLKEEQNERKKLEEKAGEEQLSENLLGRNEVCFLKYLEGARCVQSFV